MATHPREQSHRAGLCARRFWLIFSVLVLIIRSLSAREESGQARP
jgi:hypothetical protein